MSKHLTLLTHVLLLVAAATLALSGCGATAQQPSQSTDGQTLVMESCGRCHPIQRVQNAKKDRSGWTTTIARMRKNGLEVNDSQAQAIVDYLTKRDGGN